MSTDPVGQPMPPPNPGPARALRVEARATLPRDEGKRPVPPGEPAGGTGCPDDSSRAGGSREPSRCDRAPDGASAHRTGGTATPIPPVPGRAPARSAAPTAVPRTDTDPDDRAPAAHRTGPGPLLRLVRRRELAFAAVGGVNTVMGIGLTVAWLTVLGDFVPPSVGVAAAYATGIPIAFVLHRTLVFRVRGRIFRDFLAFALVNCGGLVLNAVFLEAAVTVLGFPRTSAAVVVMGAVAVATFFGHRYISFRRPVG